VATSTGNRGFWMVGRMNGGFHNGRRLAKDGFLRKGLRDIQKPPVARGLLRPITEELAGSTRGSGTRNAQREAPLYKSATTSIEDTNTDLVRGRWSRSQHRFLNVLCIRCTRPNRSRSPRCPDNSPTGIHQLTHNSDRLRAATRILISVSKAQ
jgi:hypothetical protein